MLRQSERGYVLMLVLVVLLMAVSLSAVTIRQSLSDVKIVFSSAKMNALFVRADTPLVVLTQDAAINSMRMQGGIMDKLMTQSDNWHDAKDFQSVVGFMCHDMTDDVGDLMSSALTIVTTSSATPKCSPQQAWLWFVLSKDEMTQATHTESLEIDPHHYRLTIYSLAMDDADTVCAVQPMQVKMCLANDGITHQMLAQEFSYRLVESSTEGAQNLRHLAPTRWYQVHLVGYDEE